MLRGRYTAKVDDKGRLKIPADYLAQLLELCGEERRVFVTSLDGQRVRIYPLPVWEEQERKMEAAPASDPDVEEYREIVNFWGLEGIVDPQGRLRVHSPLREEAGLDGSVSVFGMGRRLEVCDNRLFAGRQMALGKDAKARLADKYGV
jgi:MraZ protein